MSEDLDRKELGKDIPPVSDDEKDREFTRNLKRLLKTGKWNFLGSEEPAYQTKHGGIVQDGIKLPAGGMIRVPAIICGEKTNLEEPYNVKYHSFLYNVQAGKNCVFHRVDVRNSKLGNGCLVVSRFTRNCIFENGVIASYGHNFELCIIRKGAWILTPQVTVGAGENHYGLEITGWDNKKQELIARKLTEKEIKELKRQLPKVQGKRMPRKTLGLRRRFGTEKETGFRER